MTFREFSAAFDLKLNDQQKKAVQETGHPVLLLAVPGSGKTTVIVSRIGYMVHCLGIPPERILTITYTVAATNDMKERYKKVFCSGDCDYSDRLSFRTINGICAVIIAYYARVLQRDPFQLLSDEAGVSKIIRDIYIGMYNKFPGETDIKDIKTSITYAKNMMLDDKGLGNIDIDGIDFPVFYKRYNEYLLSHRLMDYDDQMLVAFQILNKYPRILEHFRSRFPYINVDEAQDTSMIQHRIIRLLAGDNIFMVGDEDQSIYGFRAAYPQALLNFSKIYPGGKILYMETNYRSVASITEHSGRFISQNKKRYPKKINATRKGGDGIIRTDFKDLGALHKFVIDAAGSKEDTAVLFRNSDSVIPIVDLLEKSGIKYYFRQRESGFFSSNPVRDIRAIFRMAQEPDNLELFLENYYKLDIRIKKELIFSILKKRPSGNGIIAKIINSGELDGYRTQQLQKTDECLRSLYSCSSASAISKILYSMNYSTWLEKRTGDFSKISILVCLAEQNPKVTDFLNRLDQLKNIIDSGSPAKGCHLTLSTIHSSKGLEFDRVILIDAVDGILPSCRGDQQDDDELEEERRLFYVAVTRAKNRLDLLTCKNRGAGLFGGKHSFIDYFMGSSPAPQTVSPEKKSSPFRTLFTPKRSKPTMEMLSKDYFPGTEISHKSFGAGTIENISGSICTIQFADGTRRSLDLPLCVHKELIKIRL